MAVGLLGSAHLIVSSDARTSLCVSPLIVRYVVIRFVLVRYVLIRYVLIRFILIRFVLVMTKAERPSLFFTVYNV